VEELEKKDRGRNMARLSKTLGSSIPEKYQKEMSQCYFCGEQITHGGMWAGDEHHLGVCKECSPLLIDWYVDTVMDTTGFEKLNLDEKKKEVFNVVERRLEKKEGLLKQMNKDKGLHKLGIRYYSELGIIDYFGLTLSVDEMKGRLKEVSPFGSNLALGYGVFESEDIDIAVEEIKSLIDKKWGESPHTVRFFGVPDFDGLNFKLCAIAKIENNGSTIIFSENKKILQFLETWGDGDPTIYEVK